MKFKPNENKLFLNGIIKKNQSVEDHPYNKIDNPTIIHHDDRFPMITSDPPKVVILLK
ncbi:MAG: hypothetical protein ACTSRE_04555 [Promethearchaeota archaeon]